MSRCFSFPPPGYERKPRPDDLVLLKEAKRKEKKHKKEKERKKDEEKKEKDGNHEKHRDKKDRKEKQKSKNEKNKDKRKDKEDLGKDKDKSSISEESTVAGKLEDKSEWKLQPEVHSKDRSGFTNEGKNSILFQGQNGGKALPCWSPTHLYDETKFLQELDRRVMDDERGAGSQLPERIAIMENEDQEMVHIGAIRNSSGLLVQENVNKKNKRTDIKIDPQGVKDDFSASKVVRNFVPITKAKVEQVTKPLHGQNERWEDKEKYKEIGVIKQGGKHKDRVRESLVNEKDKCKEKKNDENVKITYGNKNGIENQFKDDASNEPGGFTGKRLTDLLKETNSNAANEESIRKRKEYANGFVHESKIRPNKIPKPAVAPHQVIENGRKLECFQTPSKSSHAIPNSVRVDSREMLMNGLTEAHKPSAPKPKPCAVTVASNQIAEVSKAPRHVIEDLMADASRKPPHPDSKYLIEVLTVPKMENWYEPEEWLSSKKGPAGENKVELVCEQHVWSEAVHIESADVCARPYVVPY